MLSCVLFFFFKQNTAYEMRISDWSSDVCSSDLLPALAIACHQHVGRFQVLVQHADAVRRGNSVGDLEKQMQALLPWQRGRSEEHTSELQSLMRTSSAVFCLKKHYNPTRTSTDRTV